MRNMETGVGVGAGDGVKPGTTNPLDVLRSIAELPFTDPLSSPFTRLPFAWFGFTKGEGRRTDFSFTTVSNIVLDIAISLSPDSSRCRKRASWRRLGKIKLER